MTPRILQRRERGRFRTEAPGNTSKSDIMALTNWFTQGSLRPGKVHHTLGDAAFQTETDRDIQRQNAILFTLRARPEAGASDVATATE